MASVLARFRLITASTGSEGPTSPLPGRDARPMPQVERPVGAPLRRERGRVIPPPGGVTPRLVAKTAHASHREFHEVLGTQLGGGTTRSYSSCSGLSQFGRQGRLAPVERQVRRVLPVAEQSVSGSQLVDVG